MREDKRLLRAWAVGTTFCDDALNRAAATIALRFVASTGPAADFEAWWNGLRQAEALLTHMAECSPHDGNLWANLALVRRAIVVPAGELGRLVRLSERLSPAELGAMETRIEVWRSSPPAVRRLFDDVKDRDVARIRTHGWRPDVEALKRRLGEEVVPEP